jgi:hypothetical protein
MFLPQLYYVHCCAVVSRRMKAQSPNPGIRGARRRFFCFNVRHRHPDIFCPLESERSRDTAASGTKSRIEEILS